MSKTQDKRALRKQEQQEFIKERHQVQMSIFEANFEAGVQMFLANKDKMSPEEIETVEREMAGAQELIDTLKVAWEL